MVASEYPSELHERIDEDDVQVVDIRPVSAFREGHIPGAINVPFPDLAQEVERIDWGEDIVVVCPKGESSLQAARMLEAYEGVDAQARVANLEGGYRDWDYDLSTDVEDAPGDRPARGDGESTPPF